MSTATETRRPPVATRRVGYVVAVLVNASLLYAGNVWPGWETLPFLTEDTAQVMPMVNASITVSLVANVVYVLRDPRWLKALGDVVTTVVGLAAVLQMWQVFPFEFDGGGFDWALAVHVLLGIAIVGSVIGIVAGLVTFFRSVTASEHVTR
ncbi:MAG: hypothetical protein ACXWDI_09990 [Nocardioides sp.]